MIFKEFQEKCNNNICLRNTFQSKHCFKEYKQKKCFEKYLKKFEQDFKVDKRWKEVQKEVWKRDKGECQVERVLSEELIKIIRKQFYYIYSRLDGILDCMHIVPRSIAPHLVYDPDNIILGGRFYHSLLDQNRNFVTGKYEEDYREKMINRIMHDTGRWDENYCYDDYKEENCR